MLLIRNLSFGNLNLGNFGNFLLGFFTAVLFLFVVEGEGYCQTFQKLDSKQISSKITIQNPQVKFDFSTLNQNNYEPSTTPQISNQKSDQNQNQNPSVNLNITHQPKIGFVYEDGSTVLAIIKRLLGIKPAEALEEKKPQKPEVSPPVDEVVNQSINQSLVGQSFSDSDSSITAEIPVGRKIFERFSLSNRLVSDIKFYDNYQSSDHKDQYLDLQFGTRLFSSLSLSKNLTFYSLTSLTRFDNQKTAQLRAASVDGLGNRNFENLAVYLPEVNLRYQHKRNLFLLGKFTPNFGNGWRWDRGIWIQNLPGNYRQSEKIGVADVLQLGDARRTGLYELSASFFKNDQTLLYNSLLAKRDGLGSQVGNAGSSNSLSSYAITANISFDFGEDEKLSYHFSKLKLAASDKNNSIPAFKMADQRGLAMGISHKYPIQNYLKLYSMFEYVEMNNINGNSDISDNYLTASFQTKWFNRWTTLVGISNRKNHNMAASGFNQTLGEISFGYDCPKTKFFERFTAQIGYQRLQTEFKTQKTTSKNSLGLILRYYHSF